MNGREIKKKLPAGTDSEVSDKTDVQPESRARLVHGRSKTRKKNLEILEYYNRFRFVSQAQWDSFDIICAIIQINRYLWGEYLFPPLYMVF